MARTFTSLTSWDTTGPTSMRSPRSYGTRPAEAPSPAPSWRSPWTSRPSRRADRGFESPTASRPVQAGFRSDRGVQVRLGQPPAQAVVQVLGAAQVGHVVESPVIGHDLAGDELVFHLAGEGEGQGDP